MNEIKCYDLGSAMFNVINTKPIKFRIFRSGYSKEVKVSGSRYVLEEEVW